MPTKELSHQSLFVEVTPAKQVRAWIVPEVKRASLSLKPDREALKLTDNNKLLLVEYSPYNRREDLSMAISKVNDLLQISRLQKLKQSRHTKNKFSRISCRFVLYFCMVFTVVVYMYLYKIFSLAYCTNCRNATFYYSVWLEKTFILISIDCVNLYII